jgi:hypothetical protein
LEDTTKAAGVRQIKLSTNLTVHIKEEHDGHFYAIRGRHNGAALYGDQMSVVE